MMIRPVHTAVKGRARYKVEGLYRSESLKRHIETGLLERGDIRYVSANILTSNILVLFNTVNSHNTITSAIEASVLEYKKQIPFAFSPKTNDSNGSGITARFNSLSESREDRPAVSIGSRNKTLSKRRLRRPIMQAEGQRVEQWHLMNADKVLDLMETSKDAGLSAESVKKRLKKYGSNVLPESVPRSGLGMFIRQFKSLPVVLLSIAAGISIITGGIADAIVIMSVVGINAAIGYTTESQSERTIHSLKGLIRPTAIVVRDGEQKEINAEDVVPGDILLLSKGSYVSADARVVETNYLSVDESALTGESMPVVKSITPSTQNNILLADRTNMVYMGTLVTGGHGIAVVIATGVFTEIGKIQALVKEVRPPETSMGRQLDKMGSQMVLISSAACGIVFIIGLLRGYGLLQILKVSISLAVAAVPAGLPTVATTTLATGIRAMRKHNVIIRQLDAVETLGSVQTLCLDKTGTITLNKMSVVEIYTNMQRIKVYDGKFILGEESINPYSHDDLMKLLHVSILCNESEVSRKGEEYVVSGSPTENALIYASIIAGINVGIIRNKFRLLEIYHRSETRNFMITTHGLSDGINNHMPKIIAVKGRPDEVLSLCSFHMRGGKKILLTEEERFTIEAENERMAGDGLRVLGTAYLFIDGENGKGINEQEVLDLQAFPFDYQNLIWIGLIGMTDPIRAGVKGATGVFHQAGIETVMITGDQSPTAYAVGKELNLSKGEQIQILDSAHLANIDSDVMEALSGKVHVFARVSPAHKLKIVQSIQATGRVVAMTGDGINDGPAMKAADIGIAMGHTGTDVAREVSDVILEDDNIETMTLAVSHGRTIYNNIRKSVHYLLTTNLSEIVVMSTSIAGGLGQPLTAMQLLWINLLTDIAPGLALALESPEPDVLSQPPRSPDEPIVRRSDIGRIAREGTVLSASAMGAYGYGIMRHGMGQRAGTMAFMSLTLGQILYAISCRSEKHSIFSKDRLPPNRYLDGAISGALLLQILPIMIPGLRGFLGIMPIGLIDSIIVGGSALLPLVINEGIKEGKVKAARR
ncbi:cation-transporting P-type ATPase [Thermodesulfovibrionales bacterium]|nr:cation-transporting P-type ATPase [Thermodesulfovibrionales bacterium]